MSTLKKRNKNIDREFETRSSRLSQDTNTNDSNQHPVAPQSSFDELKVLTDQRSLLQKHLFEDVCNGDIGQLKAILSYMRIIHCFNSQVCDTPTKCLKLMRESGSNDHLFAISNLNDGGDVSRSTKTVGNLLKEYLTKLTHYVDDLTQGPVMRGQSNDFIKNFGSVIGCDNKLKLQRLLNQDEYQRFTKRRRIVSSTTLNHG